MDTQTSDDVHEADTELSYARNVHAGNFEHVLYYNSTQSVQMRTLQFVMKIARYEACQATANPAVSLSLPDVEFKVDKTLRRNAISLVKKRLSDGKSMEIAGSVSRAYMRIKDFYKDNDFLDKMFKPRKQIHRRMRSIESWEQEWDVTSFTPTLDDCGNDEVRQHLEKALECPTSAMLLLDRLFTHQRCIYVSGWNDKAHTSVNMLSVADIYLYFILSSWFEYYKRYISELATIMPAVIVYTQRIRQDMMILSGFMDAQNSDSFFAGSAFLETLVVDWSNYSFKYASFEEDREGTLKKVKKVSKG